VKKWEHIGKLQGKAQNRKEIKIYSDNIVMTNDEVTKQMMGFWQGVYRKSTNDITEVWNGQSGEEYDVHIGEMEKSAVINFHGSLIDRVTGRERGRMKFPVNMVEHMEVLDGAIENNRMAIPMSELKWNEEEVKKGLSNIKTGKKEGPDGIRGEMLKCLVESAACTEAITEGFNNVNNAGIIPDSWKTSKTSMIPKNKKPQVSQMRPIALTNVGYKLYMSMMRDSIVEHLVKNNRMNEYQSGFTCGRRLEDNLFMLNYCVEDSVRRKKEIYMAAIDYSKAFDSIDRKALIATMKKYECDRMCIEVVSRLYMGDTTEVFVGNSKMGEIEVTNGIRQGCTGSPLLFVMVVNTIIEKICDARIGFKNEKFYIPALFYADDGLLIANGKRELERMIQLLQRVSSEVGLEINQTKCQVIIMNSKNEHPENIQNIEVVTSIKYLGVQIGNGKRYYTQHKKGKLEEARRMSRMTYSVTVRSCNKMLIGKTYWKSVVLPSILHASAAIIWNDGEQEKLQIIENGVWRQILGAPSYAAVATLQGDVGASTVIARDMRVKLLYYKHLIDTKNELLKEVLIDEMRQERPVSFVLKVGKYAENIGMSTRDISHMSTEQVKKRIKEWGHNKWRTELHSRSTLDLYREHKQQIGEESMYDNRYRSVLMYRSRSNSLKLGWRNRFLGGDVICELCGAEVETLQHFLKVCERLQRVRERHQVDESTTLADILLFQGKSHENVKRFMSYVEEMWRARSGILRSEP
jgi:hypothetical protein